MSELPKKEDFVLPELRRAQLVLKILELLDDEREDISYYGKLREHPAFEQVVLRHMSEALHWARGSGLIAETPLKDDHPEHVVITISELGHLVLHLSRQQAGTVAQWNGQ